MPKINPALLKQLESRLDLSPRQVYRLIDSKVQATLLPRHLAAIALAAEKKINISRYASVDDLAAIRQSNPGPSAPIQAVSLPSEKSRRRSTSTKAKRADGKASPRRGTSVYVVHGRNESLRRSLFAFLRSLGLQPMEWSKAIEATGKPNPYVGEILETAFRDVVAIIVLLSPDDEARLKPEHIKSDDPSYEKRLTGQPRPNVLFEAGMAFGRNPESTVLVQVGQVRAFSDIAGRHITRLSNSTESRQQFITKLANAGCNVDASGTDWHTEGDFS